MQVVIEIPEYTYKYIRSGGFSGAPLLIDNAIKNGTPLPKGHGRLIYADEINLKDISPVDGFSVYGATAEDIDLTPTVIEVDRNEEQI